MKKNLVLFVITVIIAGCILPTKYYKARSLYMKSSYKEAIASYDIYLKSAPNSAQRIHAEIERSDCYYQLGYDQFSNKNWCDAHTLFFLANSPIADLLLDDCYFSLALEELAAEDTIQALKYFDQIIKELPETDKVPAVLALRINIYLKQDQRALAFDDYNLLLQDFSDSEFTKKILPEIDKLIPILLDDALARKVNKDYEAALQILTKIRKYPTKYKQSIEDEISSIYRILAEDAIQSSELAKAKQYFSEAMELNPLCEQDIQTRINSLCESFLKMGNLQLQKLQFDDAISTYQKCNELIEVHPQSQKAIEAAADQKLNYSKSQELYEKAANLENLRSYKDALNYYKQAGQYFPSDDINEKIFIMQNLMTSYNDPKSFAKKIIQEHRNGELEKAIKDIEQEMSEKYPGYVNSSDWMVTFAIGQYKYEVRYDIVAPDETFYFAWNVDIRTKKVIPSNKVSEKLMLDADLLEMKEIKK